MSSQKLSGIILSLSLLSLFSCGGGSSGSSSHTSRNPVVEREEDTNKLYRAILKPVNGSTVGQTSGVVIVRVDGDNFVVEQTVADAPGGVRHFQAIMSGSSCAAIDENGDGYIDIMEGSKAFGNRLIPLDSNLDSQLEGSNFGPIANEANAYIYKKSTSLAKLLADLVGVDPDEEDDLVKLPSDKALQLSSRVVLVMGYGKSLPGTVAGNMTFDAAEGLPIACGELTAIQDENADVE